MMYKIYGLYVWLEKTVVCTIHYWAK